MTAAEVINEIKVLSAEERAEVAAFLRQSEAGPVVRYADDQTVQEASRRILDRHAELMRKLAS
jgi:hypothetical protein